jgi:hypothetical protein
MFYAVETRPKWVPDNIKHKTRRVTVCSRDKKCRGEMPFMEDGKTVWRYIYWDGEPDMGISAIVYELDYEGSTYSWYDLEEKND